MAILKNSINHALAFILMVLITFLISFITFEKNISVNGIIKSMNKMNYYNNVSNNINEKLDDFILLDEVKLLYQKYITQELIEKDVNKLVNNIYNNRDYKLDRYEDFYQIIYDYSNDEEVSHEYANKINNIYSENLLPIKPLELISLLKLRNIFIFLIAISVILLAGFIMYSLYLFNKSHKFNLLGLLSSSILLIIPKIFIGIFNIFDGFIYSNNYYTNLLLNIIYKTFNNMFMIGICILIFSFITIKKIYSKDI